MPRGRAKPPLVLTGEEREPLERWARRPRTAQALAQRARIVLRCAAGALNQAVAREIGVTRLTVGRSGQRFVTWLVRHPRVHLHFTPTGASWINLVERWFAALTEKQLRRGVHRSTRELEQAIRHYITVTNGQAKPLVWTKTADEILASVSRCCHRISDSGH